MLPGKKIYIDSRHSAHESISSSSLKVELPYLYKMPQGTSFYICEVCTPHAWKTIEEGISDKLYFQASRNGGAATNNYIATIDAHNYDGKGFKLALYNAINDVCPGITISYTTQKSTYYIN